VRRKQLSGLGGIILENIAGAEYVPTLYYNIAAAGMTIIPKVIIIHVITTVDRPVTGTVHVCALGSYMILLLNYYYTMPTRRSVIL